MTQYLHRNCPNCGCSSTSRRPEAVSVSRAENLEFSVIEENWAGFRHDQIFFSFYRCSECELTYSPTYLSQEQLARLYSSMSDNTAGEKRDVLEKTQQTYAKKISNFPRPSGPWLDLGADLGLLSVAMRSQLSSSEHVVLDAVEPNKTIRSQLLDNLGRNGQVFDDIRECETGRYSGVVAIHVLDHLVDLDGSLAEVRRCLQPGGIFAIVVHNESSLLRWLLRRMWPPFCLQHPQLFSPKTVRDSLTRRGFEVVSLKKSTNYFTLGHLAEVAFKVMKLPTGLSKLMPRVTLPLKLGNLIVIARKVG